MNKTKKKENKTNFNLVLCLLQKVSFIKYLKTCLIKCCYGFSLKLIGIDLDNISRVKNNYIYRMR